MEHSLGFTRFSFQCLGSRGSGFRIYARTLFRVKAHTHTHTHAHTHTHTHMCGADSGKASDAVFQEAVRRVRGANALARQLEREGG